MTDSPTTRRRRRGKDNVVALPVRVETDRISALEEQVRQVTAMANALTAEVAELKAELRARG